MAPYSLFVSFALAIALIPPLYASHYLVYYTIRQALTLQFSSLYLLITIINSVEFLCVKVYFMKSFLC